VAYNLLKNASFLNVFATTSLDSTGAATNYTTGVTAVLSTAGSSGTGNQTTGVGGFPFASAAWDMAGYESALVIANVNAWTTAPNATLQIYGNSVGPATALSTTFTILPDAYAFGQSSGAIPFALAVDVIKPKPRFLQAQLQISTSSGQPMSINVIRYGARNEPVTNAVSSGSAALTGAAGAAAAKVAFYTTISPGTSG
jgi:hypothetical protein